MLDRLGSGDLPLLRDMPDQEKGCAGRFGVAHEIEGGGAHLGDRARSRFERRGPDGLDRIDGDDARRGCAIEGCQDVFDGSRRTQRHRRVAELHPGGPQTHLRHRFLARDVDGMAAQARVSRQSLQDQCGFPDARITADEQRRTGHEPAAAHPIEFGQAGDPPRRCIVGGLQILKGKGAAARRFAAPSACGQARTFFDDRVPAAARLALAGPFGMRRATGLAHKTRSCACHSNAPYHASTRNHRKVTRSPLTHIGAISPCGYCSPLRQGEGTVQDGPIR